MPRDLTVDLPGVRLHCRVWDGPQLRPPDAPAGEPPDRSPDGRPPSAPVVLLPATGETAQDWDVVAAALSTTRTAYAVDLRGHGDSGWPGTYSVEAMADDVVGLLGQLAVPVDLVGHSLGGLVACRAAAAAPERVRRLVLEDVGLLHPRPPAPPARPDGELDFDWAVVEQVRPQVDDPSPDWPEVLARVTAPTLVVSGGAASPVPAEHVADLVALVADGRSVTVEAGHFVHDEQPEAFLAQVLAFLDA